MVNQSIYSLHYLQTLKSQVQRKKNTFCNFYAAKNENNNYIEHFIIRAPHELLILLINIVCIFGFVEIYVYYFIVRFSFDF